MGPQPGLSDWISLLTHTHTHKALAILENGTAFHEDFAGRQGESLSFKVIMSKLSSQYGLVHAGFVLWRSSEKSKTIRNLIEGGTNAPTHSYELCEVCVFLADSTTFGIT